MDSAVERILAGGPWHGAEGRLLAAWQLRRHDGVGGPMIATRVSDGLTLGLTDRRGYLDAAFESDDDAGELVEWIEGLLTELDAADAIPNEALEAIDVADLRRIAETLVPRPPQSNAEGNWKMLAND